MATIQESRSQDRLWTLSLYVTFKINGHRQMAYCTGQKPPIAIIRDTSCYQYLAPKSHIPILGNERGKLEICVHIMLRSSIQMVRLTTLFGSHPIGLPRGVTRDYL